MISIRNTTAPLRRSNRNYTESVGANPPQLSRSQFELSKHLN